MLTVRDLMTTDVFTLHSEDSLFLARQLMNMARIRHVPILDGRERFVGLVTHRDILGVAVSKLADIDQGTQNEFDAGVPLFEIMNTDVRTAEPSMPLRQAAVTLLENKFGCLPVVENGALVGILTEADFLRLTISLLDSLEESSQ